MSIQEVLDSGDVQRYHANPHLARFGQTNAHHQWRCLALLLMLHPNPSKDLMVAAATHDCGELMIGDLAYPAKAANPALYQMVNQLEDQKRAEIGCPSFFLLPEEEDWLSLVDRLESRLFRASRAPGLEPEWSKNDTEMYRAAESCGVLTQVKELLT